MSALGNYIHLETENYLTYGVAKIGQNAQHFKAQKNFLQNRVKGIPSVNKKTVRILKERLEANTLARTNEDQKLANRDMQDKIDKLYEILAQHTATSIMGRFEGVAKNRGVFAYSKDYQNDLKKLTLSPAEIERRKFIFKSLNDRITQINAQGIATEADLNEIVQMYESAGGKLPSTLGSESILGRIQEEIQNTSFNTWISHIVGEFGENLVALCADTADTLAIDEIEKFLKNAVIGNQASEITLDKNKVTNDLSSFLSMDKENNKYFLGKTKNKVDVNIQVNSQNVLASVKTYYNASKVSLQKNVNLLAALTFLESKQKFGTHWLNMHAGSLKGNDRTLADQTLKEEIAYEALVSGNPLKNGAMQANVFVFLDRKTGRVFAKTTKDILLNDFNRIKITPDIGSIILNNNSNTTPEARITQILMEAHSQPLRVSMLVK